MSVPHLDTRILDGKKTLLLKEVQSDWHQQGRRTGYKSGSSAAAVHAARDAADASRQALAAKLEAMGQRGAEVDRAIHEYADKIWGIKPMQIQG